jgi:hypothetical protein
LKKREIGVLESFETKEKLQASVLEEVLEVSAWETLIDISREVVPPTPSE